MTTTPTPVERAAAELFDRFDIDADGYVLADVPEERAGYVEHATAVLSAALDVDEIARVLAACDPYAAGVDAMHREMAAAVVEHLTGATR